MCTGNENSKPIWNKFIIRKDSIETSQVVLHFCRTVYIMNYHSDMQIKVFTNEIPGIFKNSKCYDKE